jgi:hypothetical protein
VTSTVTPEFRKRLERLSHPVQQLAFKNYQFWLRDQSHPSLHFKPFRRDLWSARVGSHYRACGKWLGPDSFRWTWIGSHEDYNKL